MEKEGKHSCYKSYLKEDNPLDTMPRSTRQRVISSNKCFVLFNNCKYSRTLFWQKGS